MKTIAFVLTFLMILTGITVGTAAVVGGYALSYELAVSITVPEEPGAAVAGGVVILAIGLGSLIGLSFLGFKGFSVLYERIHAPLARWKERRADAKIQKEIVRRENREARMHKRYETARDSDHSPSCQHPYAPCVCR